MQKPWSFVAMQYYAIVLNRTYFISVYDDRVEGKVCRGITAAAVRSGDLLTRSITSKLAVHGNLDDPSCYVNHELLNQDHRANFSIAFNELESVVFDPRKKWGMSYYPHDGRVVLHTADGALELIILGRQSGQEIARRLKACCALG